MPDISDPGLVYPLSWVGFHRYARVLLGNALVILNTDQEDFSFSAYQNPAANGQSFAHQVDIAPGAYTLAIVGMTGSNSGKIDWYIDDVLVVSGQDWYNAAQQYNIVKTAAVTVYGVRQHVLRGVVNGKNGASTGYRIQLTALSLT
jgi:hypothetical protein